MTIKPLGAEDIRDMHASGLSDLLVVGPEGALYNKEDLPTCAECGVHSFDDEQAFSWNDGLCDDCYEEEQEGFREYIEMQYDYHRSVL